MTALIIVGVLILLLGAPIAILLFVQKNVEKTPLYRKLYGGAETKKVENNK